MQALLKIAKDFVASTEGKHLTDGKILFRLSGDADPAVAQALFQGERGRPVEAYCLELLPSPTLNRTLAVPIVDAGITIRESRPIRKGRKAVYEIVEYGIFKASIKELNAAGSVTDIVHSYTIFDRALVSKAVSLTKAHYGPRYSETLLLFQDPKSGNMIGTIGDAIPVFVVAPIKGMLERLKNKISFSGVEIHEILYERM